MYVPKPVSAGELKSSSRELDRQLAEMKKMNAASDLANRLEADKRIAERILAEVADSERAGKRPARKTVMKPTNEPPKGPVTKAPEKPAKKPAQKRPVKKSKSPTKITETAGEPSELPEKTTETTKPKRSRTKSPATGLGPIMEPTIPMESETAEPPDT